MKRLFAIVLSSLFIIFSFVLVVQGAPLAEQSIQARGAVLLDVQENRILFSKNALEPMAPAGLTKLLTALVVMDYIDLHEMTTVGDEIGFVPYDSLLTGHFRGEILRNDILMKGLILASGNETANIAANVVIQNHLEPGISYKNGERAFVGLMNDKAKDLGAQNTKMVNIHGYPHPYHKMSSIDLAKIAAGVMENEFLNLVAGETYFEGYGNGETENANDNKLYKWRTQNELLLEGDNFYPYATGIKTGFTTDGGYAVAAAAKKNGRLLIAVVMGASETDRFTDIQKMFDFGFANYEYYEVAGTEKTIDTISIDNPRLGEDKTLDIYVKEPYIELLTAEEQGKITYDVEYFESVTTDFFEGDDSIIKTPPEDTLYNPFIQLSPPVNEGDTIGKVTYYRDGEVIFESDVIASRTVLPRSFNSDVDFYVEKIQSTLFSKKASVYWIIGLALLILLIGWKLKNWIRDRKEYDLFR